MGKRRKFTPEFKTQLVLDILTGVQSQAEACRKHTSGTNLVASGRPTFLERAHLAFDSDVGSLGRAGPDRRTGAGARTHDAGERDS